MNFSLESAFSKCSESASSGPGLLYKVCQSDKPVLCFSILKRRGAQINSEQVGFRILLKHVFSLDRLLSFHR